MYEGLINKKRVDFLKKIYTEKLWHETMTFEEFLILYFNIILLWTGVEK